MANKKAKYIGTTLSKGEKIKGVFKKDWYADWVVAVMYVFFGSFVSVFGVFIKEVAESSFVNFIGSILLIWGIILVLYFLYLPVEFFFQEIVLTNKRFVYKRGIIWPTTQEHVLVKKGIVEFKRGVFGVLFGCATVKILGDGGAKVEVKRIKIEGARQLKDLLDKAL